MPNRLPMGAAVLHLTVLTVASYAYAADTPKESVEEKFAKRAAKLWSLQPVAQPAVPAGTHNPIDAFIGAMYREKGLHPSAKADRLTLLLRVYFDLIGIPPTIAEQDAFLRDPSPDAYEKVVDRLLANEQHGARWARHWLDVLRYADLDGIDGSVMPSAASVYLWRDWVIAALNNDLPYDGFVRAEILGNRYAPQTVTDDFGRRSRPEGPVADTFALGFLTRAALDGEDKDRNLSLGAVETVSSAFMGMTVACAKCHDHKSRPHHTEEPLRHEGDLRSARVEERHAGHTGGDLSNRPEARRLQEEESAD